MPDEKKIERIEETVYQLKTPVTGEDGLLLTELKFGRMKIEHLRILPKDFFQRVIPSPNPDEVGPILSEVTGIPEVTLNKIDAADDLEGILVALANFFGVAQETGEQESEPLPENSDSPPEKF